MLCLIVARARGRSVKKGHCPFFVPGVRFADLDPMGFPMPVNSDKNASVSAYVCCLSPWRALCDACCSGRLSSFRMIACAAFPCRIKSLQADNGSGFTSRFTSERDMPSLFQLTLHALGINHRLTSPLYAEA